MLRSEYFQFTLPVVNGQIQQRAAVDALRDVCAFKNASARRAGVKIRWAVDFKYRGPRFGARYMSPKQTAYAVDVYSYPRQTDPASGDARGVSRYLNRVGR
jgi:hypothetical protein